MLNYKTNSSIHICFVPLWQPTIITAAVMSHMINQSSSQASLPQEGFYLNKEAEQCHSHKHETLWNN